MDRIHTPATQTDLQGERWMFDLPAPMELVVEWDGRTLVFPVLEFGVDEIVVVDFDAQLDLAHHDATLDFCDEVLLDEVHCKVAFRGLEADGVARLRLVAFGWERMELMRLAELLHQQMIDRRKLEQARVAAACGWI